MDSLSIAIAGVDTEGRLFSVTGFQAPHDSSNASSVLRFDMHKANKFMWCKTVSGLSFAEVVTTARNAHKLHAGTLVGVSAPISGFVFRGVLFLDPAGPICEPASLSDILNVPPSDAVFGQEYTDMGMLASGPMNCVVSGHALLGVTRASAKALTAFLLREASVTVADVHGGSNVPQRGRMRRASEQDVVDARINPRADTSPRVLGKAPVSQSAGNRRMLFMRVVWNDQGAAAAMDATTYATYTSSFTKYANDRAYGNMRIVPIYTPACIYRLPSHSSVEAEAPENGNSVAGWIFSDRDAALQNAAPGCVYTPADFEHVFMIIEQANGGWAGVAYVPGETFIVQVRGLRAGIVLEHHVCTTRPELRIARSFIRGATAMSLVFTNTDTISACLYVLL